MVTPKTHITIAFSDEVQIQSVSWNCTGLVTDAPGSDLFPITWADDEAQYTAWGDGYGFAGVSTKHSWGVSKLTGASTGYTSTDVYYGPAGTNKGKVAGIISVDGGTLYGLLSRQGEAPGGKTVVVSTSYGSTWHESTWSFGTDQPYTFVSFGKDNANAPEGYAYAVGYSADDVYLLRVPSTGVDTLNEWRWYSGAGPTWSSQSSNATPIIAGVGRASTSILLFPSAGHVEGLNKVLLNVKLAEDVGQWKLYESTRAWGPYTLVESYSTWCGWSGAVTEMLARHIAPKWVSGDGSEVNLVFSATNQWDRFNLVKATLTLS